MSINLGPNTGVGSPPTEEQAQQIKDVLSLGNVEDVALSTWIGSSNLSLSSIQIVDATNDARTTPNKIIKSNSSGNVSMNSLLCDYLEIGSEDGNSGGIRIINSNGNTVSIDNANNSSAGHISMPTNSGTLAVVSSSNGNINITDVSTLSAVLSGKLDATNEALGVVISEDPSIIANLFETITVDYIQTADQSASTIPDGCFGRKGSDPYFGEVPLLNSKTAFVSDVITSTGSPSRILVGSIPISAEEMQQGYALLNINLMAAIAGSTRDFAIWFDFQEGTGDTTGFAIVLVPTGNSHYLFNGRIYFSADGLGKIALNILSAGPSYIHSGGASQCAIFDDWFDPAYGSPTYLADENEANAIKIYITDISATALDTCNVEGSVSFRKL